MRIRSISYLHYFCWNSLPHFTALQYTSLRPYSTFFFFSFFFKAKQLLSFFVAKNTEHLQGIFTSSQPLLYNLKKSIQSHDVIQVFPTDSDILIHFLLEHMIRPPYTMVLALYTQHEMIYRTAKLVFCLQTCTSGLSGLP